jgi:hypothetical protein
MIICGSGRCFWAKNTLCLRGSIRLAGFKKATVEGSLVLTASASGTTFPRAARRQMDLKRRRVSAAIAGRGTPGGSPVCAESQKHIVPSSVQYVQKVTEYFAAQAQQQALAWIGNRCNAIVAPGVH